jgi:16S rRNA (guanine966-N2)-methyltransferase
VRRRAPRFGPECPSDACDHGAVPGPDAERPPGPRHPADLRSGSGALAIEALSRGAASATLVDSSRAAIEAIRANLIALGAEAEVRRQPALAFLGSARVSARQYDLVFLDPPYRQAGALGRELSTALAPVLAPGARVVAESDRRAPLELVGLTQLDERSYGDTLIALYGP